MSAKDGEQKERRILLRRISTGVERLDKLIGVAFQRAGAFY
jgi:hypothetical protein